MGRIVVIRSCLNSEYTLSFGKCLYYSALTYLFNLLKPALMIAAINFLLSFKK